VSYNFPTVRAKGLIKVVDSAAILPNFVHTSTLTGSELDAFDVQDGIAGWPPAIVALSRAQRTLEKTLVVGDRLVSFGGDNPFLRRGDGVDDAFARKLRRLLEFVNGRSTLGEIFSDMGLRGFETNNRCFAQGGFPTYKLVGFPDTIPDHFSFPNTGDVGTWNSTGTNYTNIQVQTGITAGTGPCAAMDQSIVPANKCRIWYMMSSSNVDANDLVRYTDVDRDGIFSGIVTMVWLPTSDVVLRNNAKYKDPAKVVALYAESSWKDLFVGFPDTAFFEVVEDQLTYGDMPIAWGHNPLGPRTGGLRRLGWRWWTGVPLGSVCPAEGFALEGDVTITHDGTVDIAEIAVAAGARNVEWDGNHLNTLVDDAADTDIVLTVDEKAALANTIIRSVVVPATMPGDANALEATRTYILSDAAGHDFESEIYQEEDAVRGITELTYREAADAAAPRSERTWHILRMAEEQVYNPGLITISGTPGSLNLLLVDGDGVTLFNGTYNVLVNPEDRKLIIDFYWAGSSIRNISSLADPDPLEALATAIGSDANHLITNQMGKFIEPDSERSEFQETVSFWDVVDPRELTAATYAAQSIVQYSNSRKRLGNYLVALIAYGRAAAQKMGVNSLY
jgi:hypothetical protein